MFLPKVSNCLRLPVRKPSPTPISSNSEPTPQAIPNMVRKERSLCAHRVRSVWAKMASNMRMKILQSTQEGGRKFDSAGHHLERAPSEAEGAFFAKRRVFAVVVLD